MRGPAPSLRTAGHHGFLAARARQGLRALAGLVSAPGAGGRDWLKWAIGLAALVGVGVVLGTQYLEPNKRVIALAVAAAMFGVAWRLSLILVTGLVILTLPYPRGMVFGSTNVVLVLGLLLIWLVRVTLGRAPPPERTPVDLPIVALLIAFVVSFYNIENAVALGQALSNFHHVLTGFALLYVVVNCVRRPEHLERLHGFQCVSIAIVGLFGLFEISNPTGDLVPGWLYFRHAVSDAVNLRNIRIGGPFFDFELLSEYCAINVLLVGLMLARARSGARRALFAGLLVMTVFIMFATVTRGGIVALLFGLAYLAWLQRRRLKLVPVVIGVALSLLGVQLMNFFVTHFTHAGDLIMRMLDPSTVNLRYGMPEARLELWQSAIERMMRHPWIGHGPVYTIERGLDFWFWPHNGYLLIGNMVGIFGLACFLWLAWRLWRLSRPLGDDLNDPNYARAFLIVARVQMLVFLVDQTKIEFLRNTTYASQVWLMFAYIVAAYKVARVSPPTPAAARARR